MGAFPQIMVATVKQEKAYTPSIMSAIQKLIGLLTREEKLRWLGIVGFALIVSLLEVLTASVIVVFAQILNDPSVGQRYMSRIGMVSELSSGRVVFYMAVLVGTIYLIKNIIAAVEVFFQNISIQQMGYNFKNKLLHGYAHADYSFHLTRNSSFGLQVVGGDAEVSFSSGMVSIASVISESIIFVCLVGMVVYMNPALALIVFTVFAGLSWLVSKFLLPLFYGWGQKLQQISVIASQNLMQFFHAFKEIVLLSKREAFIEAYHVHSKKRAKIQAIQTATNALPRLGIEVLFVGVFVLTISYLCMEDESPMQMIGLLSGYLYAGFRLMPGLNRIINQLSTFKSIIPSIERVHMEYTTAVLGKYYLNIPDFKFEHSITFKNVDYRYLNTDKNALSCVTFEIKKGECIGIVGETGSGKSTLIDLLLGLLRPIDNTILIDNQYPVNAIQWHQRIGYVPQAVYLIDDTIEANIAFGEKEIDEKKLNHSIGAAQLRKFIDSMPNGSKTFVGERGIRLSGGERQRIAIARALYLEPEVLIFDEATSALDNETEARLMDTINAVSKDRTVIMIAHRLTTLKKCDRIIQMDNGMVKSINKFNEIFDLQNSSGENTQHA